MVFERGTDPGASFYFAPELRRFEPTAGARVELNYFVLTYYIVYNKRLPPPYPSKCFDYDGKTQSSCFKDCIVDLSMKEFDKFPFSENIYQEDAYNLDKTIINNFNLSDQIFSDRLRNLETICESRCSQPDCEERAFLTEITLSDVNQGSIAFRVNLPKNSNFFIDYQPMILFLEYLTYVLGCLGSWLGFYVLQLNPYNIYMVVKTFSKRQEYVKRTMRSKRVKPEIKITNEARNVSCKAEDDIWLHLKVESLKNAAELLQQELAMLKLSNHLR